MLQLSELFHGSLSALEQPNLQQRRGGLAFLNEQGIHGAKFFADGEKQIHQVFRHLREIGRLRPQFQFQQMAQARARLAQALVSGIECDRALGGRIFFRGNRVMESIGMMLRRKGEKIAFEQLRIEPGSARSVEQCEMVRDHALKLSPQEQLVAALGFFTLKPPSFNAST
ncbi:MAG: hypothetical protein V9H26_09470 [Verrucomicrobiota bacterium]